MTDYKLTEDGLYAYRWPRASVTADAVLFAEKDGQTYVLLIQRGNEPYKGCWAFPGGFLEMDETVARCAERELEEETGIVLTRVCSWWVSIPMWSVIRVDASSQQLMLL